MRKLLRSAGNLCLDTLRLAFVGGAALSLVVGGFALANNYLATVPGSGTSFASVVISSTNYLANLICDATAGESQCAAVNGSGQIAIQAPPSLPLPSGAATSANQSTEITSLSTIATNTGAAVPAGTNVIGFTSNDPCSQATKSGGVINLTASGQIFAGTASKKTYICSLDIVSATAQNIALVEGTGTVCATNIFGLAGGTTAATGWNLAANGGLTKGSGSGTVFSPSADANGTAANVCLLLSSTGQTSGQITYVQQ